MTNIIVQLPEDIAQRLESRWKDLPRAALESLALEAYRSELLTTAELRQLLGDTDEQSILSEEFADGMVPTVDIILQETERILADYVALSH